MTGEQRVRRSVHRVTLTSAAVCATGLSVLTAGLFTHGGPDSLDVERASVTAQQDDGDRENFVIEAHKAQGGGAVADGTQSAQKADAVNDEALTVEDLGLRGSSTAVETKRVGGELALPGDLRLAHPVEADRISSPYGTRSNPTGNGYQFHIGQDYPTSTGADVLASGAGEVTFAGWHVTGGWRVEIDHGDGVTTAYSHNSQLEVDVGQQVSAGEAIAAAGSTGNSTGPHVHLEIVIDGETVDPRLYLPPLSTGTATYSPEDADDVQVASTD